MKKTDKHSSHSRKRLKWLFGVALVATIPVVAWAASTGTYSDWLQVGGGSNSFGSSSYPTLVVGSGNTADHGRSALIGNYLISGKPDQVVVGTWNKTETTANFIVGTGYYQAGAVKQNAFEVHADGKVIVNERQGDIPMGIYGN